MFTIYKVTSKSTGKSYIGVTNQPVSRRWYQHQRLAFAKHNNCHFHKAIRKYGAVDFVVEEIFQGFDDLNRKECERFFISEYDTYHNGYNGTEGGEDFTSSDYQRELQMRRVKDGTHPFLGGEIQRITSKKRWQEGTNSIQGLNTTRVSDGTHNFLGESNPQRLLAAQGKHHNQKRPWLNTKQSQESLRAWKMADILYNWFVSNRDKKRGGSYKAMQDAFGLNCSLQKMYYNYFLQGWIPSHDPDWVAFAAND